MHIPGYFISVDFLFEITPHICVFSSSSSALLILQKLRVPLTFEFFISYRITFSHIDLHSVSVSVCLPHPGQHANPSSDR